MKQNTLVLASFILLLCIVSFISAAAVEFTVTAAFDYETYGSMSYIRFSIDKPHKLPVPPGESTAKLFDVQLPRAFSNIQERFAECTRASGPAIGAPPMFTFLDQTNEGRGFELMYPANFERNDPSYQTQLNCVIKIKSAPIYTALTTSSFPIKLLSPVSIFATPEGVNAKRLNFEFTVPALVTTTAGTSSRLFPESFPFVYGDDLTKNRDETIKVTKSDVYTTTVTIDRSLLALRKNNKLIFTHPFPFRFERSLSFCSSPHDIIAYDINAQAPVSDESTLTEPITGVALSLSQFAGEPKGISCQITITPVFTDPLVTSYPASQVGLVLEYGHYNKTGTSSFSNFYKTFTQRTFQELDPKTIFPAFDSAIVLATPPIALRPYVTLAPLFLNPVSVDTPFWNRYSITLDSFAFASDEALFVTAPDKISSSGLCFQGHDLENLPHIQVHNCMQLEALTSCPDFDFYLGATQEAESKLGVFLVPKQNLRFMRSVCLYNFQWFFIGDESTLSYNNLSVDVRIVKKGDITPVTATLPPTFLPKSDSWKLQTPYVLARAPTVQVLTVNDGHSFKSPFVGGQLAVQIDASPTRPLKNGFRIIVQGPRLTIIDSAWIPAVYSTTLKDNVVIIGDKLDWDEKCINCIKLTTETLPEKLFDSDDNALPDGAANLYPVLTYLGDIDCVVAIRVIVSYPGFKIPLTKTDYDSTSKARVVHYGSSLSQTPIQGMPDFISKQTSLFYTLSKNRADVEAVFNTISWWTPKGSATGMEILADTSNQVGSVAGSDEWFIYEEGYMGLLMKNTKAMRGDTLAIVGTTVTLADNSTSTTNLVLCTGNIYQLPTTTGNSWVLLKENVPIFNIQTNQQSIRVTLLESIEETYAVSCAGTVYPRYPAGATELFQIPTLAYESTLFARGGASSNFGAIQSLYSTSDYLSDSQLSSQNYPFTYELPVDISNVIPTVIATLTNAGNPEDEQDIIYSGSYTKLNLTIAGMTLNVGSPSAIQIEFTTSRLQAPDTTITSQVRLLSPPTCPNADVSISYSNSQTIVTITLNQAVIATVRDPYTCTFFMMVGPGNENETAKITVGNASSTNNSRIDLGSTVFKFLGSPYEINVLQSDTQGGITFSLPRLGPLPILFHNVIPFTTIDPYCKSSTDQIVAHVQLSQALGLIVLTPDTALFADTKLSIVDPIGIACTFQATKTFNSPSTSVRYQVADFILPEVLTLPAVSDRVDHGLDVILSTVTLPNQVQPTPGLFLDLYHEDFANGDYVQVNLPPGSRLGVNDSRFPCSQRLTVTTSFISVNSTYYVRFTANGAITSYDEIQCSMPIQLTRPQNAGELKFFSVKRTGLVDVDEVNQSWTAVEYKSTFPQISSEYRVKTSYGLQWSSATKKGQLQLVLDILYESLSFSVRSNTLTYNLGGMKSPSDIVENDKTKYAGGDPTVNVRNPYKSNTEEQLTQEEILRAADEAGIAAGAAVISSKLDIADCYVPYTDVFGNIHTDSRISAQYIRETNYKLHMSIPNASIGQVIQVRCVLPIYVYNQQFVITPKVTEFPTNFIDIDNDRLPQLVIATWFPSPNILMLDDAPKPETPEQTGGEGTTDGETGQFKMQTVNNPRVVRKSKIIHHPTRVLGTTDRVLERTISANTHSTPSSVPKSAQLLRLFRQTNMTALADDTNGTNTDGTDGETETTIDPTSSDDLTQDIRYMEILFVQPRFFNNAELDDIITTIHSLVSKRDRTINLNSLLVLAQTRPPIQFADEYVSLRIGFAGLDVESTLLEAKFAGLEFTHWLSTNYEVSSWSRVDKLTQSDYRYNRSKVPIECLKTAASINQITQTCGVDCGRLCPDTYSVGGDLRLCRTDMDCESLNCDMSSNTCQLQPFNFVRTYTGVYSKYGQIDQTSLTFEQAYNLLKSGSNDEINGGAVENDQIESN